MKKIFLIIAAILTTTTLVYSQQVQTVKGKTKDGKSINVQYIKGTAQDYIQSVKYELVDELKAENQSKQKSINDLQHQLNKANNTISDLREQLKRANSGEASNTEMLEQKQAEINQLNEQNNQLEAQLREMQKENERLLRQVDSLKQANARLSQNNKRPASSPVIGIEGSFGAVTLLGNNLNNPWEKALSWNKQVAVYYGTGTLINSVPLTIEAGIGFHSLPLAANLDNYNVFGPEGNDSDGDPYQPQYIFNNCTEKLTMNCVDVPIRLCYEHSFNNKVSLYTKLGIMPTFILSSSLSNSPYTRRGLYTNWNVYFDDVEELDFFSDGGAGSQSMTPDKRFTLNGNLAVGAYVPLSQSILFNVGARFDYLILKTGTFTANSATDNYKLLPETFRSGLNKYNGSPLTSSLQLGLVYKLK